MKTNLMLAQLLIEKAAEGQEEDDDGDDGNMGWSALTLRGVALTCASQYEREGKGFWLPKPTTVDSDYAADFMG